MKFFTHSFNSQTLTAFITIVRREIYRFFRIWSQTILPSAITLTLYFTIFGTLIGTQIHPVNGVSYMQFIAPGLIMMAIITNSYTNVVGSFYGARFGRYVEEMLVAPVPDGILLTGYVTGGIVRGLVVAAVVTTIALFFTHLSIYSLWITVSIIFLAAILFSLAGFCNAVFAKKFDDISIIPTFILTPLTYFGGVFYTVDILPPFFQKISYLNPILYIVNTFRYGILGQSDVDIVFSFVMVVLFNVILAIYCMHLLRRGVGLRS